MALYDKISDNIKSSKQKFNNAHIRNLRIMNVLSAGLMGLLTILDIVFLIRGSYTGLPMMTRVCLIIFIIFQIANLSLFMIRQFSRASMVTKILIMTISSLPIIAYIPFLNLGDGYSAILLVNRIIAVISLAMLLFNTKSTRDIKIFMVKGLPLAIACVLSMASIIAIITANRNRKVIYAYDINQEGYIVKDVFSGKGKVKIDADCVGIGPSALKNVSGTLNLPAGIRYINPNAFEKSNVTALTVTSEQITMMDAVEESKINKIYLNADETVIDLYKDSYSDIEFLAPIDTINEYRYAYSKYDYLFSPNVDDVNYICYDGTGLAVKYFDSTNNIIEEAPVETLPDMDGNKLIFTGWYDGNQKIEFPYTVNHSAHINAKFNYVYDIKYISDVEVDLPEEYYEDLGEIELPELSQDGYVFRGWFDKNQVQYNKLDGSINTNLELTAKFSKIYNIIYDSGIGVMPEEYVSQYADGDKVSLPILTKTGYTFDGWYLDGGYNNKFNDNFHNDLNLFAKFSFEAPTYNIDGTINKKFDDQASSISISASHSLPTVDFRYEWINTADGSVKSDTKTLTVKKATDSGVYKCKITVSDGITTSEHYTDEVNVIIEKLDYDMSNVKLEAHTYVYDGLVHYPKLVGQLPIGIDGLQPIYSFDRGATNVSDDNVLSTITFTSISENYNDPESMSSIVNISPKTVTLAWDNQLTYTYTGQIYTPSCSAKGLVTGDVCDVLVEGGKNSVGIHTAIASSLTNSNYKLPDENTASFEIRKAQLSHNIVVNDTQVTYNGQPQIPEVLNLPSEVEAIYSEMPINVGTYDITVSFVSSSSTEEIKDTYKVKLTVKPVVLDISWDSLEFDYNGTAQRPEYIINNLIGEDNVTITLVYSNTINASDNYSIEMTKTNNPNYVLPEQKVFNYKINKIDYDMSGILFENKTFIYNGKTQYPAISGQLPIGLDNIVPTVSYIGDAKNVCENSLITAVFETSSYNYNVPESLTAYVTISALTVDVKWGTRSFIYNGEQQVPVATIVNLVEGDDCELTITGAAMNASENPYTATITAVSNPNYKLGSNLTCQFKISNKVLNYTINADDLVLPYTGDIYRPSDYVTISGEDGVHFTPVLSEGLTNAGTSMITVSFVSDDQANYPAPEDIGVKITITPIIATLSWDKSIFEYNGKVQAPKATVTNLIDGDVANVIYDSLGNINVNNNYKISAIDLDNSNYKLDSQSTFDYAIIKANYDLSGIKFESIIVDYDGTPHNPTIDGTITGVDGIAVKVSYSGSRTDAGSQIVYATFEGSENYNPIPQMSASVTIKQVEVKLVWSELEFEYNGKTQAPTCSAVGLKGNDECDVTVVAGYANAGTHNAEATQLSNSNYKLPAITTVTYVIKKAKLNVSLDFEDYTSIYDGQVHYPILNGTIPQGVSYSFDHDYKDAGSYDVSVSFVVSANYESIAPMTAKLVIEQKEVTITWENTDVMYTGQTVTPKYSSIGVIPGDSCDITVVGSGSTVGTYTVTATGLSNPNYKLNATSSTELHIIEANYNMSGIVFADESFIYDGKPHHASIKGSLPTGADGISLQVLKYTGEATNVADGYVFTTVTFTTTSKNYNIPSELTVRTRIIPKDVSINWTNTTFEYDGKSHIPTPEVIGLLNGDTCSASATGAQTNAGTYTATISSISNSNYNATSGLEKTYTINKAKYDMSSISLKDIVFTYNGLDQQQAYTGDLNDVIGLDLSTPVFDKYVGSVKNVSEGTVVQYAYFVSTSDNYENPDPIECNISVSPITVTVKVDSVNPAITTANAYISNSSISYTYDGVEHNIVLSIDNSAVIEGDNVSFDADISFKDYKENGYTVKVVSDNENYISSIDQIKITISRRHTYWITWNDLVPYEGTENLLENPDLEIQYYNSDDELINYNPMESNIPGTYTARLVSINPSYIMDATNAGTYKVVPSVSYVETQINGLSATSTEAQIKEVYKLCTSLTDVNRASLSNINKLLSLVDNKTTNKLYWNNRVAQANANGFFNVDSAASYTSGKDYSFLGNSYNSSMKFESGKGVITFTNTETIYLTIATTANSISLDDAQVTTTVKNGSAFVFTLEIKAGSHTIKKSSTSELIYISAI